MERQTKSFPSVRYIGLRERPWASKSFQTYLGTFKLCTVSGFYFDPSTPAADKCKILSALKKVPRALVENARALGLTMSTCKGSTPNGNSSTTYADFSGNNLEGSSPHIVMGSKSLEDEFILPHLIHELSHLYFANGGAERKAVWTALICDQASVHVHEVTEYAQSHLTDWLEEIGRHANREKYLLARYASESFCESVAALVVPSYAHSSCTVDMQKRRSLIEEMGLKLKGKPKGSV